MKDQDPKGNGREGYHHGNLREALVQAALALIAERGIAAFAIAELARAVGVSAAAPYRHFRDREAVVAEVARRGFEALEGELQRALDSSKADPLVALERCAQAHLAYAAREAPVYSSMFEPHFPAAAYPELSKARNEALAVMRRAAEAACDRSAAPRRPPALMVALHVWSLTHGIASLFVSHDGETRSRIPMAPEELLEAGLLVYLRSLDLPVRG